MMSIKQIVLLGAGASKSEGAPLQNELFKEFFGYYRQVLREKTWTLPRKREKLIINFFKNFWGIDIDNYQNRNVNFPTFEECLGILDLAHLREESLRGCPQTEIEEIRNALIFLIAKVLDEKLRGKIKHHIKLVNRLKTEGTLKETAFISLNYDIIIDNVLTRLHPNFHLDYGIDFVNFDRVDDWERPNIDKSISLFKIHGSLNWLFCPTCNQMELTPGIKGAISAFHEAKKCGQCRTPMKPVIVPPTFYKEMSNPFIRQIILKTDQILRQASRILVCGYSFPDADIHIKYLLKRAERFKGATPEICVINNHTNKTEQKKEEERQRFKRFFKDEEKVQYTNLSFEEFSEKGVTDARTPTAHTG